MKKIILLVSFFAALTAAAQNTGIGTNTPQATLDVKGSQRIGGTVSYMRYDSSGKIEWINSSLYVPGSQALMTHSAAADGLFYNNTGGIGKIEYRNAIGQPVFYTSFVSGDGYFKNNLGIGDLTPQFPLSFSQSLGDKISLWSNSTNSYGFGIQGSLLQIHTDVPAADIAFGYGSSAIFNEAMRIKGTGNVGIGTVNPATRLHVTDSSVLFSSPNFASPTPGNPPISGAGRRMMWYSDKAAFRVGYVNGVSWDKDSIGNYSFASGANSKAKGDYSTAMGDSSVASGLYAVAMGYKTIAAEEGSTAIGFLTTATGPSSTAMGAATTASGVFSTSMGVVTIASGDAATAMGVNTIASGDVSTAIGDSSVASGLYAVAMGKASTAKALGSLSTGSYNDITDNPNPNIDSPADRIFQVGNGTAVVTRGNAITILRNGNTGIGTVNPNALLQLGNSIANRKIVLWEGTNNDHEFYGFGVNGATLRYQIPTSADAHVFFTGSGPSLSAELFRINGNGNTGVGVNDPAFRLDVGARMRIRSTPGLSAGLWLNNDNNITSPAFIGMKSNDEVGFYGQTGAPGWRFYINTTTGNGWMQGTLTQNSDQRLKKNISVLENSLQKLTQLHGYHYYWKNEQSDSRMQTGVLAQEVQKFFPELVAENKDGILAVNYSGLIPVVIESIREQQRIIEKQQQQIDELKKLVEKLLK